MLNRDEILRLLEARGEATHAELAARTDAGPDVLNFLAEQGGPAARRAVAANIAAPPVANRHLAHDTSSDVREELARKIGRILPGISADASAEIREITFETLEILAEDQMPRVRAILAEEIKSLACVPKKIIDRLARDVELVSAPILEYSPLLSDADLIDIITTAQARHVIMSIARRRTLSANVADAVAQARDIPSVKVLLENASADIRRQTLDKIADQAERIREWHSPLAQRPDLSQRAILRIASFVGSSLLEKLLQRNGLDESLKTHLSAQLRQRLEAGDTGDNAPSALGEVHALHAKGKLDENYVAQAADDGRREAVIAALSLLSGAKQDAVARILQARAAKPVIALVWRAGLGMRVAMRIQSSLLKLTARELVPARGGIGFPLTEEEMRWHLGYFDVPA